MASREEVGGGGGAPKLSSSVKLVLLGEAAVGKVGFSPLATLIVAVGEGPCTRCFGREPLRVSLGEIRGQQIWRISCHVTSWRAGVFPVDALGLVG